MFKYVMTFITSAMVAFILGTMTNEFFVTTFGTVVMTALSFKFWQSFFKIIWNDYLEERL